MNNNIVQNDKILVPFKTIVNNQILGEYVKIYILVYIFLKYIKILYIYVNF